MEFLLLFEGGFLNYVWWMSWKTGWHGKMCAESHIHRHTHQTEMKPCENCSYAFTENRLTPVRKKTPWKFDAGTILCINFIIIHTEFSGLAMQTYCYFIHHFRCKSNHQSFLSFSFSKCKNTKKYPQKPNYITANKETLSVAIESGSKKCFNENWLAWFSCNAFNEIGLSWKLWCGFIWFATGLFENLNWFTLGWFTCARHQMEWLEFGKSFVSQIDLLSKQRSIKYISNQPL